MYSDALLKWVGGGGGGEGVVGGGGEGGGSIEGKGWQVNLSFYIQ